MKRIRILTGMTLAMFLTGAAAQASNLAIVTNSGSNNVSMIDTSTRHLSAAVPVGLSPFAAAIAPDGARAYVTSGRSNSVSVINTATNAVAATVPAGYKPLWVAIQ